MTAMVDVLYSRYEAEELLKNQRREHPIENLSYLCKICSKRFVSERAFGGNMRAHVSPSVSAYAFTETEFQKSNRPRVSDDKSMDEKVVEEGFDDHGSNLMDALRRNPKLSWQFADWDDSSLNGELCEKEFSSWKSKASMGSVVPCLGDQQY